MSDKTPEYSLAFTSIEDEEKMLNGYVLKRNAKGQFVMHRLKAMSFDTKQYHAESINKVTKILQTYMSKSYKDLISKLPENPFEVKFLIDDEYNISEFEVKDHPDPENTPLPYKFVLDNITYETPIKDYLEKVIAFHLPLYENIPVALVARIEDLFNEEGGGEEVNNM